MRKVYLAALLTTAFIALPGVAQTTNPEHQNMAEQQSHQSPATKEFEAAMDKMHGPMMKGIMDQDPDVAFVQGMIPHHEGAVAMAKTVLKYGKDPEIRQLAENVIRDQDKEIKKMQDWLAKHKKP